MYYQNVGYRWGQIDGIDLDGACFSASSQNIEETLRRSFPQTLKRTIFDPQLYILNLEVSPDNHSKLLARLATYPWFGLEAPSYESAEQNQSAWKRDVADQIDVLWQRRVSPFDRWEETVRSCLEFQVQAGFTSIILPAPLIRDPEDRLETFFTLLDEAVDVAASMGIECTIASLPLAEDSIMHKPFMQSDLVEAIADELTAREEISGVYLPVVSRGEGDRLCSLNAVGALLRLSSLLARRPDFELIINFAESIGLVARALGAAGYCSGYTLKQRRFCIDDFMDSGFGIALPKFLSLSLLADFYPERDLERMAQAQLLRLVATDSTNAGDPLLRVLEKGGPARSVPAWDERRNNIAAAQSHYTQLQVALSRRPAMSPREVLGWLQAAEANAQYLKQRFKDDPLRFSGAHHAPWRSAVEAIAGPGMRQ